MKPNLSYCLKLEILILTCRIAIIDSLLYKIKIRKKREKWKFKNIFFWHFNLERKNNNNSLVEDWNYCSLLILNRLQFHIGEIFFQKKEYWFFFYLFCANFIFVFAIFTKVFGFFFLRKYVNLINAKHSWMHLVWSQKKKCCQRKKNQFCE